MNFAEQRDLLAAFADRWGEVELYSTGSQLINYPGVLYNVDGSSDDPQISGESWKGLLIANGINAPCYVTNETPNGNSHPKFSVGGHMTPNPDGKVEFGADSYLMPLCSWHNSKARDGVPFTHTNTLMLKLSGFMEGEIAATFMARLPSEKRHSIVYSGGDSPMCKDLSEPEAAAAIDGRISDDVLGCHPNDFILMERVTHDDDTRYVIKATSF
jgi:hypothetical protein